MVERPSGRLQPLYGGWFRRGNAQRHGMEQIGFWNKILNHPAYDAFWRDQAMDRVLAAQPLKVPVMLVHSLWDAEDIYGATASTRRSSQKIHPTTRSFS